MAELRVAAHQSHHLVAGFYCFGRLIILARHNPLAFRTSGSRANHIRALPPHQVVMGRLVVTAKGVDPFSDGMRGQEIVDVGNVLRSYKAALAVGVQDPRGGDLDPQVVGLPGAVQRQQRPAGAMRGDANGSLAASCSDHAGTHEVGSAQPGRCGREITLNRQRPNRHLISRARPEPAGRGAAAEGLRARLSLMIGVLPDMMEERAVPDSWNAEVFRQRAEAWRQKAASLPQDRENEAAVCLEISEGYAQTGEPARRTGERGLLGPCCRPARSLKAATDGRADTPGPLPASPGANALTSHRPTPLFEP